MTRPLLNEDHPAVLAIATGKRRLSMGGLRSTYRLSNGWIAVRQEPENGWARQAYWTLYVSVADLHARNYLGGGAGRLTRAIVNVFNGTPGLLDTLLSAEQA